MSTYKPYTYLIGWSSHNKFYYGVRYATKTKCLPNFDGCHPNDLWKSYFTSSKHVHEFREKYGEPDIVQVRRIFEDKESAIAWEEKVLRRLHVKRSVVWLNVAISGGLPQLIGEQHPLYGVGHNDSSRKKMSLSHKGKKLTAATREKMSISRRGDKNPMYGIGGMLGKKHTDATKLKMSESSKGRAPHSEDILLKISEKNSEYKWWSNGVENKRSKTCPGDGWSRGRLMNNLGDKNPMYGKSINKGMLWWHKDGIQIRNKECPGEGWKRGRLFKDTAMA